MLAFIGLTDANGSRISINVASIQHYYKSGKGFGTSIVLNSGALCQVRETIGDIDKVFRLYGVKLNGWVQKKANEEGNAPE